MNQLRTHLKFTFMNHLRLFIMKKRLKKCGQRIFLEKNVQILRFPANISIDDDVIIKEGAKICACNQSASIKVGRCTSIGYSVIIFASGKIEIGENCMIAPNVYIVDSDHGIKKSRVMMDQDNITQSIKIGNDVWVAANVTILKGVTISDGAIIGANSVVNTNVGPYEIFAGVPARKIGERQ